MIAISESETWKIQLPQFEGPFDLLLFFIERDELEINDIPIARITHEFLSYIQQMERMNIEVASEFILVASTLMRIKAKMLLPRPVIKEDGTIEDPRAELVNRLLEYKRYKDVMADLERIEEESIERLRRGYASKEEAILMQTENPEDELIGLDLYSIMKTFYRVWERQKNRLSRPKHVIQPYPYTMEEVRDAIRNKLDEKEKIDFVSFILDKPDKYYCVFSFLSVLELAQANEIHVIIGKGFNNFWIARPGHQDVA